MTSPLKQNRSRLIGRSIADRYCITGVIGTGGMGQVYRAIAFEDPSHEVAIKVILRNRKLASDDLLRFQKEAALMARLHHPNIIYFHELGILDSQNETIKSEFGNGYYIVMEVAHGVNLKEYLAKEGRKDLDFFLDVGIQVASALDYTHGKNIVHRDIKPQNIVVGPSSVRHQNLSVKVLDFGVARLVDVMQSAEGNMRESFEDVAGTPMYMAPEQTHHMKAPKDHRVDLYSLGCVLYEILAGRPPFTAKTRDKLEREHVYSDPEPLRNIRPDIPIVMEQIVSKLLAKHPSERYQTAFSVLSDLQRAKRFAEKNHGNIPNFALGANDRFQAVSAQLELVGRDQELSTLISTYNEAAQERSRSRMTVIEGSPGSGKTRLLAEFRSYLIGKKVRFVSTSFSKHENSLPFNALANGFNEYLTRIRKNYPAEAEELRRKVKTVLGPVAHHVASVVPGLKPFIANDSDPEDELPDENNFQNFTKAFSDFTRCLAIDNQPVVFIFDDLHWADEKSLELIDEFFSHNNSQSFVMVVSHRSVADFEHQKFGQLIEKFRKLKRRFIQMQLRPLETTAIQKVIGNMLSSPESVSFDLVNYLEDKTKSNPLHLVEFVRTLVARNFIQFKPATQKWEYELATIKSAKFTLETIDLVLSRIQTFRSYDRQILELAAASGMSFKFSLLIAFDSVKPERIHESLQKALDEGIISLSRPISGSPGVHEMEYSFSHPRIRETVYEGITLSDRPHIHEQLLTLVEKSQGMNKTLDAFALAHHTNRAYLSRYPQLNDPKVNHKLIDYNANAGLMAWKSGSYQSAQRYYENSYHVIQSGKSSYNREKSLDIVEQLADIIAIQKRHSEAIKIYYDLLKQSQKSDSLARITQKIAYFQTIGGQLSSTLKLVEASFSRIRFPLPQKTWWNTLLMLLRLLLHAIPRRSDKHPLVRGLARIYVEVKKTRTLFSPDLAYGRVYEIMQNIYMRQDTHMGLLTQDFSLRLALDGRLNPHDSIRAIAKQAAFLGYLGFAKTGFMVIEYATKLARSIKAWDSLGYISFLRVLYLDYRFDKTDELNYHWNLSKKFLSAHDDRISFGHALCFEMWMSLIRGDIERLLQLRSVIPDNIPSRSWLAPRAYAIYFYGLFLSDKREILVQEGERFLNRRQQLKARADDPFVRMIHALTSYSKGEIDKTREYFKNLSKNFYEGVRREFLAPFEEDFVTLFLLSFPMLFEQEYKRRLMRDLEMKQIWSDLAWKMHFVFGKNRGIICTFRAKIRELNNKKPSLNDYDAGLKLAKASGNKLMMVFSYLWFGEYLLQSGKRSREDYLRQAHHLSYELKLKTLSEVSEKLMEQRKMYFVKAQYHEADSLLSPSTTSQSVKDKFVSEHLQHLVQVINVDSALEQNLEESLDILKRHIPYHQTCCVVIGAEDQKHQLIFPHNFPRKEEDIIAYLSPYLNLRSTLFLPASDAPWSSLNHSSSQTQRSPQKSTSDTIVSEQAFFIEHTVSHEGVDRTLVLEPSEFHQSMAEKLDGTSVSLPNTKTASSSMSARLQMNGIIPVRLSRNSFGVIFIEDIQIQNKDVTQARQDLDTFGAQLGILFERKGSQLGKDLNSNLDPNLHFQQGSYLLEPCSWLKIWTHGKLRASREAVWYLGLTLNDDQYLLCYSRCNGETVLREKIGAFIWHHLMASRTLLFASGRSRFETSELRDEMINLIDSIPQIRELQGFAFAFTIFNRAKKQALSGHFGPSRPIVLGQSNQVAPQNDVILSFSNGLDLRYWSVNASMAGVHTYFMTHDSSKLDAQYVESQSKAIMTHLVESRTAQDLHKFLEKFVPSEQLPRYYLAAVQVDDVQGQNKDQDEDNSILALGAK